MEPAPSLRTPLAEPCFRLMLALEVEKAARLRYYVSLICLVPDVPTLPAETGLTEHVARTALRQLRRTDVGSVLTDGAVNLLLVDADPRALSSILDRAAGSPKRGAWRFTLGPTTVSVSAGGSCYPVTVASGAELLREASDLMRRARRLGGDRLIVPPLLAPPSG